MTPFLVITSCVRNEADILDAFVAFHLNQGADLLLLMDHGSDDGTTDILDHYRRMGYVRTWRVDDPAWRQSEWMTRMAEAALDLGATWVVNADVDEFWMPRVGSLREVFLAIPGDVDLVHAFPQGFLPAEDDGFSAERQTVWDTGLGSDFSFFSVDRKPKVAHRAGPGAVVRSGNHRVLGLPRSNALGWLPIDILHFPVRSYAQLERKVTYVIEAWRHGMLPEPPVHKIHEAGMLPGYYRQLVDPTAIAERLASGQYAEDTRLADALAPLADAARGGDVTSGGHLLREPQAPSSEVRPEVVRAFRIGAEAVSLHTKPLRDERKALRRELQSFRQGGRRRRLWRRAGARFRGTLAGVRKVIRAERAH